MAASNMTPPPIDRSSYTSKWMLDVDYRLYLVAQSRRQRTTVSPAGQVVIVSGTVGGTYGNKSSLHALVLTTTEGRRLMLNPTSMILNAGSSRVQLDTALMDKLKANTLTINSRAGTLISEYSRPTQSPSHLLAQKLCAFVYLLARATLHNVCL